MRLDVSPSGAPVPITALTPLPVTGTFTSATNAAGSHVTGNVSTVTTLSVPANAVGFILEAKDSNAANIRWAIGSAASTTVGMQLQPGRDSGFVPCAANISVCSESGTNEYQLQWILTA